MHFHIITIFPNIFDSYLNESIIGRAIKNKLIKVEFYNPRNFVKIKTQGSPVLKHRGTLCSPYRPVDDKPYGGGPGMVMRAEPILKTIEFITKKISTPSRKRATPQEGNKRILIIDFIPSAEKFTTVFAKKISKKYTDVVLICGRYEGIDARVDKILKTKKFSIGDYVLTGGEIPAIILVDCVSRQIKSVLGNYESLEEERVSSSEVYTRPEVLKYKGKNYKVPKILLSGNHQKIEEWKKKE
ncbi:MAG: tRNA (guanosine(37)-N1)-methyltransferase TrmD [Patescibacteria group bacterium]